MGNCGSFSFDSSQVDSEATVKLVVHDGGIQEFSFPIKVSYLLQVNPGYFICNSDDMDFDVVVKAVRENDVLRPGQLYFTLPLDQLNHPLRPEEMAALAVKAAAALAKSGGVKKSGTRRREVVCCRKVVPEVGGKIASSIDGSIKGKSRNGGGGGGGGGGRGKGKFTAMLSTIHE